MSHPSSAQKPILVGIQKVRAPRLVLATHNAGKVQEILGILDSVWLGGITDAATLGLKIPDETRGTFEGNASQKAEDVCAATGCWALADDSGLCLDALGGLPGVDTAHYGGYLKLISAMEDVPVDQRTATFVGVLALARPGMETLTFRGEAKGHIAVTPRGEGGFGYDPVFVPEGDTRTFAEMGLEAKLACSHRTRVLMLFRDWLATHPHG